jgi:hypothetical protein
VGHQLLSTIRKVQVILYFIALMGLASSSQATDAAVYPVHTINASDGYSWAEGTPLKDGVNIVYGVNIAEGVSLPPATGSGRQIDVHLHTEYFTLVWVQPTDQINQYGQGIAYAVYPRQRLRFIDVKPGFWDFSTNLPMFYPILNDLEATAGGSQNSLYLAMGTNVIKRASAPGDSLRMPLAVGGTSPILIYNDSTVRLDVFPDYGQKINQLANDEAYSLSPGKLAFFQDIGPGPDQWVGGAIDAGYTLQFQSKGNVFNPESATTYYLGQGLEATTFAQIQRMRVPRAGRITSISASFINQGQGSSEVSSFYLRKNNTEDTLIAASVKNDFVLTEVANDDLNIEVKRGDHIELKWVTPGWITKPIYVTINGIMLIE